MRLVRHAIAATAAAALVMVPAAATADRHRDRDGLGDMWSSPVGTLAYTAAPGHVEGDIIATRVVHAPRAVWIRVRFRDLTTTTNGNFHRIAIKSDRRSRYVAIDALPGHWGGTVAVTDASGRPVACLVTERIDYERNEIHVKVPRRCLGKPDWVRVGVRSTVAGTVRVFTDDAHSLGVPARIALGPRVRH